MALLNTNALGANSANGWVEVAIAMRSTSPKKLLVERERGKKGWIN